MAGRLERLLRPRSIAVIGGREAEGVVTQCDRLGFAGEIWPVNPRRAEIGGRPCFASVDALPGAPDAAFVGVERRKTIEVVAALAARGAGGAVGYASGFRETAQDLECPEAQEGAVLQAALLEAAGAMPLLGPNCYGLINYLEAVALWPDEQGGVRLGPEAGGVAIVTQSSNIAITLTMQRRGLPLAYVVTAGNQAQTGVSEIASALLEDPRVTALGLHIEGFDDVAALQEVAVEARRRRTPVVAMKLGRSAPARAAAATHTASLTGSDAGAEALFHRLGIARVDSLPGFLETLKLLHVHGPLPGFDVASMSCSGGEAALIADAALGSRLRFRPLSARAKDGLGAVLGPRVTLANPLDYHTYVWGDEAAMTAAFAALLGDGFDLSLLLLDLPRGDRCDPDGWRPTLRAFEAALAAAGGRGALVATLPETLPEVLARALVQKGVAPLLGISEALAAAEAAAAIGAAWSGPEAPGLLAVPGCVGPVASLDEAAAKACLRDGGIAVPDGHAAAEVAEAVAAAEALGFPVAVKALGLDHKTEAGALRLGLDTAEAVRQAAEALLPLGRGLLVERMVEGGVVEMILGLQREPGLGFLLTLGAGGVLAEVLRDTRTLLLPAGEAEIRAAIAGLGIAPLLAGYRGGPRADLEALVAMAAALGRFAEDRAADLEALDLNPVIVCAEGRGAVAADALVRIREKTHD